MPRSKPNVDLLKELQEPLDRIAEGFERIAQSLDRLDQRIDGTLPKGDAPLASDPITRHMRRYLPFYAIAAVWALMLVLLPTLERSQRVTTTPAEAGAAGPETTIEVGGATAPGVTQTKGSIAAGRTVVRSAAQSLDVVKSLMGKGTTRGGVACNASTRQIPHSEYAAQCLQKFEGDNGGSTFLRDGKPGGVTRDKIKIVFRDYPDSANRAAVDAFLGQAGLPTRAVEDPAMAKLIPYFNKNFETYGRDVFVENYTNPASNGTDEVQGKGRTEACNDALHISKTMQAFSTSFAAGSEQFVDCAFGYELGHFAAAAYYAESYYKKWAPYAWHRVTECERIARQVAEYSLKRLALKPAKFAGEPDLQAMTRKFGTYVPDNEGYQICVRMSRKIIQDAGHDPGPVFNYALDVSRFADQAEAAILSFKFAAGGPVTTIVLACDPISMILLTQAATRHNYHPEWFVIGTATNDLDMWARLTEQDQTVGHLFGMSQLGGSDLIFANDGEMRRSLRAAGVSQELIDKNATGRYWELLHIYSAIQLAGPELNYTTLSRGLTQLYPLSGLGRAPLGRWSFAQSHTAIIDSKEIYWTAPDNTTGNDNGTYKHTYGGKRFTDGEWPAEEPPIYPGGKTN